MAFGSRHDAQSGHQNTSRCADKHPKNKHDHVSSPLYFNAYDATLLLIMSISLDISDDRFDLLA
jgi:hypothetical protein